MGLDNNISIKRNTKSMNVYNDIKRFETEWDAKYQYDFDVIYYRKCWNIRNIISHCIDGMVDNGRTPIEREHIPKIIEALKSLNADNWNDMGDSIWEFEEQQPHIKQHIKDLEYLYELMGKYALDVYFYDSH